MLTFRIKLNRSTWYKFTIERNKKNTSPTRYTINIIRGDIVIRVFKYIVDSYLLLSFITIVVIRPVTRPSNVVLVNITEESCNTNRLINNRSNGNHTHHNNVAKLAVYRTTQIKNRQMEYCRSHCVPAISIPIHRLSFANKNTIL